MKEENIIIRAFTPEDSLRVYSIINENLLYKNSKDYPSHIISNMCKLYTSERLIELSHTRHIFVAEILGCILGTASLESNIVCAVYVAADHQGKGIGKSLMKAIEHTAKQNSITKLQIYASITALNFYYSLDYKYVRAVDDLYAGKSTLVEKQLL